ncbi:MAG: lipocalin-like domain-containing protein [Bacteroidetes bacterium]|nr:lipocalin-like domain-containing protein [Bacteroidota bacterium]
MNEKIANKFSIHPILQAWRLFHSGICENFLLLSLLVSSCFLFACNTSIEKNKQPVAGLWKLHIIETKDSLAGKWIESEWMKGGTAYLHYDETENMSIHFTPAGYEHLNIPDESTLDSLPLQELKALASDYWYIAKYKLLENEKVVQHSRIMHSKPSEWGRVVRRNYTFHNDTLILSALEFGFRLKWVKQ